MSKGLIALRKLQRGQYGTREQFNKQLSIIEKELKTLETIKELKCFIFYEIDNQYYVSGIGVSKEEFDLLKEVLL